MLCFKEPGKNCRQAADEDVSVPKDLSTAGTEPKREYQILFSAQQHIMTRLGEAKVGNCAPLTIHANIEKIKILVPLSEDPLHTATGL